MVRFLLVSLVLDVAGYAAAQGTPPQQPSTDPTATVVGNPAPSASAPGLSDPTTPTTVSPPPKRFARVSGAVMASRLRKKVAPVYPPEAKANGVEGTVVLSAIIGVDGTVGFLAAVSGPPALADAAVAAVRQWTYDPYRLNGTTVAVSTTVTVRFNLNTASSTP